MNSSAAQYAKEIAKLKMIISEKESLIETMSADIYNRWTYFFILLTIFIQVMRDLDSQN